MDINSLILKITLFSVPFLLAVTVHEVAHGLVAKYFGDRTAEMLGRLTLNPVKHIDPLGTVILPLILLLSGSAFLFGWAKPIPVNTRNLRTPKKSMALVAAAGPLSNAIMALAWALLLSLTVHTQVFGSLSSGLTMMAAFGVMFNVLLAVFNMLPLPPLDGGRVAVGVLPYEQGRWLARLEPYGLFIIFGLVFLSSSGSIPAYLDFFSLIGWISGQIFSLVGI